VIKVCHFSSAHRGLDVRIFNKECASLAAAGYETHLVINADPNDVEMAAKCNVTVHPLPPRSSGGRIGRMLLHTWHCYRLAKSLKADIYHFHDPELIPHGMLLAITGKKVIYDVHEDLPRDIETKEWIPGWARNLAARLFGGLEHFGAKYFFSIITATPHIENRFKKINLNALAINNYPLINELAPEKGARTRLNQVCYVGGLSRIRGIRSLIDAMVYLPNVRLVLCGRFAEADLEDELMALPGWAQVDYLGHVDREGVRKVMSESFAGMVTLLPTPAYLDSLPIKMFEYMSAELPVIASNFPLWRDIVHGAIAGFCVNPESPDAIAAAIRRLADDPAQVDEFGKAGRKAVLIKYNWPTEASKLIQFYRNLP